MLIYAVAQAFAEQGTAHLERSLGTQLHDALVAVENVDRW